MPGAHLAYHVSYSHDRMQVDHARTYAGHYLAYAFAIGRGIAVDDAFTARCTALMARTVVETVNGIVKEILTVRTKVAEVG